MLGNYTFSEIVYLIISILLSLTFHEAMHAYAGYALGDTTAKDSGRLSINPLKHIDPFMTVLLPIVTIIFFGAPFLAAKPVPFDPRRVKFDEFGAALIALAGPVSNLLLAIIGAVLLRLTGANLLTNDFLSIFVTINIALFVFNILPIPPLDGSRVLYAFAPEGLQDFMRSIEPYGFFIIIALVFTNILTPLLVHLNSAILNLLV